MKNAIRTTLVIATFALLAACGGPTINGKNEVLFKQSIEEIVSKLDMSETRQFQSDLETYGQLVLKEMGGMSLENLQKLETRVLNDLHGKSAKDLRKMVAAKTK